MNSTFTEDIGLFQELKKMIEEDLQIKKDKHQQFYGNMIYSNILKCYSSVMNQNVKKEFYQKVQSLVESNYKLTKNKNYLSSLQEENFSGKIFQFDIIQQNYNLLDDHNLVTYILDPQDISLKLFKKYMQHINFIELDQNDPKIVQQFDLQIKLGNTVIIKDPSEKFIGSIILQLVKQSFLIKDRIKYIKIGSTQQSEMNDKFRLILINSQGQRIPQELFKNVCLIDMTLNQDDFQTIIYNQILKYENINVYEKMKVLHKELKSNSLKNNKCYYSLLDTLKGLDQEVLQNENVVHNIKELKIGYEMSQDRIQLVQKQLITMIKNKNQYEMFYIRIWIIFHSLQQLVKLDLNYTFDFQQLIIILRDVLSQHQGPEQESTRSQALLTVNFGQKIIEYIIKRVHSEHRLMIFLFLTMSILYREGLLEIEQLHFLLMDDDSQQNQIQVSLKTLIKDYNLDQNFSDDYYYKNFKIMEGIFPFKINYLTHELTINKQRWQSFIESPSNILPRPYADYEFQIVSKMMHQKKQRLSRSISQFSEGSQSQTSFSQSANQSMISDNPTVVSVKSDLNASLMQVRNLRRNSLMFTSEVEQDDEQDQIDENRNFDRYFDPIKKFYERMAFKQFNAKYFWEVNKQYVFYNTSQLILIRALIPSRFPWFLGNFMKKFFSLNSFVDLENLKQSQDLQKLIYSNNRDSLQPILIQHRSDTNVLDQIFQLRDYDIESWDINYRNFPVYITDQFSSMLKRNSSKQQQTVIQLQSSSKKTDQIILTPFQIELREKLSQIQQKNGYLVYIYQKQHADELKLFFDYLLEQNKKEQKFAHFRVFFIFNINDQSIQNLRNISYNCLNLFVEKIENNFQRITQELAVLGKKILASTKTRSNKIFNKILSALIIFHAYKSLNNNQNINKINFQISMEMIQNYIGNFERIPYNRILNTIVLCYSNEIFNENELQILQNQIENIFQEHLFDKNYSIRNIKIPEICWSDIIDTFSKKNTIFKDQPYTELDLDYQANNKTQNLIFNKPLYDIDDFNYKIHKFNIYDLFDKLNKYQDKFNEFLSLQLCPDKQLYKGLYESISEEQYLYIRLLKRISKTKKNCEKILNYELNISSEYLDFFQQIYEGKVPTLWQQKCYPIMFDLNLFIDDLNNRLTFITELVKNQKVEGINFKYLFSPKKFIINFKYNFAHQHHIQLGQVQSVLQFPKFVNFSFQPKNSIRIYGIHLKGAQWNQDAGVCQEILPSDENYIKELNGVFIVNQIHQEYEESEDILYNCPVYNQRPEYVKNQTYQYQDNNLIMNIMLKMQPDISIQEWQNKQIEMFCQF